MNGRLRANRLLMLLLCISSTALAQENAGQGLSELLRGNERFGRKLLQQVHAGTPDRNMVVSPISLSLLFLAIQVNSGQERAHKEIGSAFGWGTYPHLRVPARMLMAAFEEPERRPPARNRSTLTHRGYVPQETAWITNTLLYRSTGIKDPLDEHFVASARKDFGVKFVNTGNARPGTADLQRARKSLLEPPGLSGQDDLWISSVTHLQTAWRGNTFSMSKPRVGEFHAAAGQSKQVEFLDSEVGSFLHAQTDSFEAVALPCNAGYMLAVLPARGKGILELERDLAEQPESLDAALKRETGFVTMPAFHVRFESDLRSPVEALGITGIFEDIGPIIKIPHSHITEIVQKVDIEVNRDGIRADAETVAGVVVGGMLAARKPFHMVLDRPFIFLVRDQNTNALLFIGAVMDPSQN